MIKCGNCGKELDQQEYNYNETLDDYLCYPCYLDAEIKFTRTKFEELKNWLDTTYFKDLKKIKTHLDELLLEKSKLS